jgi:hypothetical protein
MAIDEPGRSRGVPRLRTLAAFPEHRRSGPRCLLVGVSSAPAPAPKTASAEARRVRRSATRERRLTEAWACLAGRQSWRWSSPKSRHFTRGKARTISSSGRRGVPSGSRRTRRTGAPAAGAARHQSPSDGQIGHARVDDPDVTGGLGAALGWATSSWKTGCHRSSATCGRFARRTAHAGLRVLGLAGSHRIGVIPLMFASACSSTSRSRRRCGGARCPARWCRARCRPPAGRPRTRSAGAGPRDWCSAWRWRREHRRADSRAGRQ